LSDTTSEQAPARPRTLVRTPVALALGALVSVMLIAAGVIALVGGSSPTTAPKNALVGTVIRGFVLRGVNGRVEVASPWSAGHPAVVLFFAKWCTPCHREVPALARVIGRGDLGGVLVIGVDEDVQLSAAQAFVRATRVHFPVGQDQFTELASALVPGGLPAAVFVRANGQVVDVQYGSMSVLELSAGLSDLTRA
jgi:thiol-disulfide isomerase/thioredoxin